MMVWSKLQYVTTTSYIYIYILASLTFLNFREIAFRFTDVETDGHMLQHQYVTSHSPHIRQFLLTFD